MCDPIVSALGIILHGQHLSFQFISSFILPTWCLRICGSKWLFYPCLQKWAYNISKLKCTNFDSGDGFWVASSVQEKRVGAWTMAPQSLSLCWVSNFLYMSDCIVIGWFVPKFLVNYCWVFEQLSNLSSFLLSVFFFVGLLKDDVSFTILWVLISKFSFNSRVFPS